jgi:hypothetical protein
MRNGIPQLRHRNPDINRTLNVTESKAHMWELWDVIEHHSESKSIDRSIKKCIQLLVYGKKNGEKDRIDT